MLIRQFTGQAGPGGPAGSLSGGPGGGGGGAGGPGQPGGGAPAQQNRRMNAIKANHPKEMMTAKMGMYIISNCFNIYI